MYYNSTYSTTPRNGNPVNGNHLDQSLLSSRKNGNSLTWVLVALTVCFTYPVLYRVSAESRAGCLAPSKLPPSGQPGLRAGAAGAAAALLASEAVPSEDAGFLSHVHTDRPLGRPRGPLLQQHVGLLVVQRRPGSCPSSTSLSSTANAAVAYLKA